MPSQRILIYVLRRDLRLTDNPIFHEIANSQSSTHSASFTHVLPIYIFHPRQFEVSGFLKPGKDGHTPKCPYPEARSAIGGYWRCNQHRAKFNAESVWDLKKSLESVGSGLCLRVGELHQVLADAIDFFEKYTPPDTTPDGSNSDEDDLLASSAQVTAVWMTEEITTEEIQDQKRIQRAVESRGKEFRLFQDEKFFIDDRDLPFRDIQELPDIYTSFRKSVEPLRERPRKNLPRPTKLPPLPGSLPPVKPEFQMPETLDGLLDSVLKPLDVFEGLPNPPRWPAERGEAKSYSAHPFEGGESNCHTRLEYLVRAGHISKYKETRNGLLGEDFSTKLSGWLSHGCVTARYIHAVMALYEDGDAAVKHEQEKALVDSFRNTPGFGEGENAGSAGVRFELVWRDYFRLYAKKFGSRLFSLYGPRNGSSGYNPSSKTTDNASGGNNTPSSPNNPTSPTTAAASAVPQEWKTVTAPHGSTDCPTREILTRFLSGRTGTGFIDASQRELLWTGYTSNRARQNGANYLAKHLHIDWRLGAEWYESMLIDYDTASNWGNWQYVSGVGNDPREGRFFNPVKQALDYDPKGEYVKAWVPELEGLEVLGDDGKPDEGRLLGLYQAWTLDEAQKEKLGLKGVDFVESPLARIHFSVNKPSRNAFRGRGGRGRGRGRGWRGRGSH